MKLEVKITIERSDTRKGYNVHLVAKEHAMTYDLTLHALTRPLGLTAALTSLVERMSTEMGPDSP